MANRTYSESDGRFDMGGGDHDTEDIKIYNPEVARSVAAPTTVGEQAAMGGWTRSEIPVGVDPGGLPKQTVPLIHRPSQSAYMGGTAGKNVAAHPGTPTPTPGTTY